MAWIPTTSRTGTRSRTSRRRTPGSTRSSSAPSRPTIPPRASRSPMTHRVLITAAASFAIALGAFGLLARGGGADRHADARAVLPSLPPPSATTDQRIAALQQTVRAQPQVADGYTLLAGAYAQKVRETGDASFYNRADGALRQALALDPRDPAALTQRGALEFSRHDFRAGLRDALAARRIAPQVGKPFGVLVD